MFSNVNELFSIRFESTVYSQKIQSKKLEVLDIAFATLLQIINNFVSKTNKESNDIHI